MKNENESIRFQRKNSKHSTKNTINITKNTNKVTTEKTVEKIVDEERKINTDVYNENDTKARNEIYSNLLSKDLADYVNSQKEQQLDTTKHSTDFKEKISEIFFKTKTKLGAFGKIGNKIGTGLLYMFTSVTVLLCTIVVLYAFYASFKIMPVIAGYYNESNELVENSSRDTFRKEDNSYIYNDSKELLATLKVDRNSNYVKYEDIPENIINAFIAVEDKRFYQHDGVDLQSTAKAIELVIRNKMGEPIAVERGGSTITQQLARNIFLTHDKTYVRKIKEIFIALELEKKYSKKDILEFYINNVYYYNNCYGIASASQMYYGKSLDELSLHEIATLCAIPNSPTYYDPVSNPENNKVRRNVILKCMLDQDYISEKDYRRSIKSEVSCKKHINDFYNYEVSYAIDCAVEYFMKRDGFEFRYSFKTLKDYEKYRKEYLEEYDLMRTKLFTGGYKIYTTINEDAQRILQEAIDNNLDFSDEKQDDGTYLVQGASTIIDNQTGNVIGIVGGRTQESDARTLNRAFQSYNQPGSTFKPLAVYTPAFEYGYEPDTIVNDHKFEGGPKNSDDRYKGLMHLSDAVIESRNTVAWQIFDDLKPSTGLGYVQSMNFSRIVPHDFYNASSLGGLTYGVNTVEMASGYATIANLGKFKEPTCISSIIDNNGDDIYFDSVIKQVYKKYASKEMTAIMEDVIKKGTGKGLSLKNGMPSAGKTGTTNNQKSAWFCGFSPYYTISVWVGTDTNEDVKNLWGGTYPGRIWKDTMNALCSGKPVIKFDTVLTKDDLIVKYGKDYNQKTEDTNENSSNSQDEIITELVNLLYDYENMIISSNDDLIEVENLEKEIVMLLDKIVNNETKNFYQQMYNQSKQKMIDRVDEYKRSQYSTEEYDDNNVTIPDDDYDIGTDDDNTIQDDALNSGNSEVGGSSDATTQQNSTISTTETTDLTETGDSQNTGDNLDRPLNGHPNQTSGSVNEYGWRN